MTVFRVRLSEHAKSLILSDGKVDANDRHNLFLINHFGARAHWAISSNQTLRSELTASLLIQTLISRTILARRPPRTT